MLVDTAIIVPLAPGDVAWRDLTADLAALPAGPEILFTGPKPPTGAAARALSGTRHRLAWIRTPLGRARQMNVAARATRRRFLWFLHADSRLAPPAVRALDASLRAEPRALHYFDLAFATDRLPLMRLSNAGVWLRSHLLGLPFGDQG